MKSYICLLILVLIGIYSCNKQPTSMTAAEIELINSAPADTAFYVLQTTSEEETSFLRLKSQDVNLDDAANNKDLQLLIERMKVTLAEEQGVGLAAPQIGISRNLFLFMRIDKPEYPVEVVINPKIVNHPDETVCFEGDGCLSIPDRSGTSMRYPWIDVEYYNEKGELKQERLSGYSRETDFTGIIFQHEFDHLQGVLFIDKLCE